MKRIYKLFLCCLSVCSTAITISCSTDEPNLPIQIEGNQSVPDSNPDSGSNKEEEDRNKIQALVKEHVKVNAYYSNFAWHFEVESTLHQALPNETIKYGIGHGDVNGTTYVSIEDGAYEFEAYMNNGRRCMNFTNPIIFYWIGGLGKLDRNAENIAETGLTNLYFMKGLERKMADPDIPFSTEEKLLYKELTDWFKAREVITDRYYHPSVEAIVGNKYYTVVTYSR